MIYESPDKGKTIYAREAGSDERELISEEEERFAFGGPYEPSKWDEIFTKMECDLNFDLPLRIRNWLRNSYQNPWPKR